MDRKLFAARGSLVELDAKLWLSPLQSPSEARGTRRGLTAVGEPPNWRKVNEGGDPHPREGMHADGGPREASVSGSPDGPLAEHFWCVALSGFLNPARNRTRQIPIQIVRGCCLRMVLGQD